MGVTRKHILTRHRRLMSIIRTRRVVGYKYKGVKKQKEERLKKLNEQSMSDMPTGVSDNKVAKE